MRIFLQEHRKHKGFRFTKDGYHGPFIKGGKMKSSFKSNVVTILDLEYQKTIKEASTVELYNAVSKAAMKTLGRNWGLTAAGKKVCYLSAEFLVGRLVYSNLYNMGLLDQFNELVQENNLDIRVFEDIEDAALGNGGLGRLAACFLDSGATIGITINGYGIRYKYGLFKQYFEDGFQKEIPDDWQRYGDPWSIRKEDEKVRVDYKNQSVYAIPYDYPVIGYDGKKTNTLRLWQSEPLESFNFEFFNEQKYDKANKSRNEAEAISSLLYPNDNTYEGKKLRLKQEYFFSAATLADVVNRYKKTFGSDFSRFSSEYAIQLNDTHPVVAIPELIRILMEDEKISFATALKIARKTFAYTNHTVMSEALEKWSASLFKSVIPKIYKYIIMIQKALLKDLCMIGKSSPEDQRKYLIIDQDTIHMARLAIYASHSINGVSALHTEILKREALNEWYELYPERFNNKTNGITQRRWLAVINTELSDFITKKIGDLWITNLEQLKNLEAYADDKAVIQQFDQIKQIKKRQLAEYINKQEGILVNPDFIFDIQVKRLHEYKRQLLNAFSILDIYFGLKEGRITDFNPTVFIFGAKSAPGYFRAKGIIKFINEVAKMIERDVDVKDKLQVIFIQNYNVSYAEKLMPAADVSEQISTAGTEASGTGNMKFMLNGAVTLGTFDGANVEIVEQAGEENNYIFGARVEHIRQMRDYYNPREVYENNPRIKKVLDTLVDGTFHDGNTGMFKEIYDSLLNGAGWDKPDHYYLLLDFIAYCDEKLKVNKDYSDRYAFRRKCFLNTVKAGKFSSDRTIKEYANEIWK
jgi:glycogen/starch/alpha-glucan phosphorylases